jgi:branched-subunit amino acid aminotransferase/4-amino-4-deoxychorismate lyase
MVLETAPVGTVLEGTVRARVLAAAEVCGLKVEETAPDPRNRGSWSEAFVCNAVRILQPVHSIECPEGAT